DAVGGDLERRQLLLGGGIGIQGDHRALVEPVEGVGRVAIEQPDVSGLAEVSRQPREVAVRIGDQRGDQGPILEMLAEREYELVALEIGERSEEHTSELQSRFDLVCRLLLEK